MYTVYLCKLFGSHGDSHVSAGLSLINNSNAVKTAMLISSSMHFMC